MSLLQKSASVELSRRTQPFYAKTNSYNLGRQVQVEIDTQREYLDMESMRFVFELHNDGANSIDGKSTHPWTASACIKNLRIKTLGGQMVGHEIREYRATYRFFKKMGMSNLDARTSRMDLEEGALGADALGGVGAAGFRQFSHKPMNHILGISEYYPAHFHQGLMVEVDLSDNAYEIYQYTVASNAQATASTTIQEFKILVDLIQLKPEIENEMVRLMEEQKLFVDYIEWLVQENALTTSQEAYDVVGIDGRVKAAFQFGVVARGRDGTDDFWGDDDAAASAMGRNGLVSYRFRLGSRYLNYAPIVIATDRQAETEYELSKALDVHCDNQRGDVARTYVLSDTAFFGVGVKVDKAQCDTDEVISSQVDKDRNNLRVELSSKTAAADGYTIIVLDKRLQLLPGSIVRNVRS